MKVIVIEDTAPKYVDIMRELKALGATEVCRAKDSESGIEKIEQAIAAGVPYDLLVSDMHFPIDGEADELAGEKTFIRLKDKGIDIPVVFCSSQKWEIPGMVDSVLYSTRGDWQRDFRAAIEKAKEILQ